MKIYFFGSQNIKYSILQKYIEILNILKKNGVSLISNLEIKSFIRPIFTQTELETFSQRGEPLMAKMDGLIIEGSVPNEEIGYLIAFALAHKRFILYMLEKGTMICENLKYLKQNKETKRLLNIEYYTDKTLEKTIIEFINKIEGREAREIPSIKFTLRITPRLEQYLTWKTKNKKISKADFLRQEIIEEMMKKDEDYKKFLNG